MNKKPSTVQGPQLMTIIKGKTFGNRDNFYQGGYSLIWPIRGCATGQGMVFGLFVLNRINSYTLVLSFVLNKDLK